jgi:hypothetical protein
MGTARRAKGCCDAFQGKAAATTDATKENKQTSRITTARGSATRPVAKTETPANEAEITATRTPIAARALREWAPVIVHPLVKTASITRKPTIQQSTAPKANGSGRFQLEPRSTAVITTLGP